VSYFERAPRLWEMIATAAVFVLTWIDFSPPFPYRALGIALIFAWSGLVLLWGLRLCVALARLRLRVPLRDWPRWLHFPLVASVMVLAIWANAPLRLGFALSRPAIDRAVRDVRAGKLDPSSIHWLGIYPVSDAQVEGDGFSMAVADTDDQQRFVLDRSRCAAGHADLSLGGHWYAEQDPGYDPECPCTCE
jgi:hypothetical protein